MTRSQPAVGVHQWGEQAASTGGFSPRELSRARFGPEPGPRAAFPVGRGGAGEAGPDREATRGTGEIQNPLDRIGHRRQDEPRVADDGFLPQKQQGVKAIGVQERDPRTVQNDIGAAELRPHRLDQPVVGHEVDIAAGADDHTAVGFPHRAVDGLNLRLLGARPSETAESCGSFDYYSFRANLSI